MLLLAEWETVEVDGLILRRKRRLAPEHVTQAASKRQQRITPSVPPPQPVQTAAQSPALSPPPAICQGTPQQQATVASPAESERLLAGNAQKAALAAVSDLVEALARPEVPQ